jgi:hypothetical protein
MLHLTVTRPEAGRARVALSGHLDAAGAEAVERIIAALEASGEQVELDTSELHGPG